MTGADVQRSMLCPWRKLETVQAHLNALRVEAKRTALNGVLSLQPDAIETISRLMIAGSDSTTFKTACYVLERIAEASAMIDPREMIRQSHMSNLSAELLEQNDSVLGGGAYRRQYKELNI